jgi:hypothetical protein
LLVDEPIVVKSGDEGLKMTGATNKFSRFVQQVNFIHTKKKKKNSIRQKIL